MDRNAVFGAENPPVVVEHGGRRFEFSTAITFGVISEVETALYEKSVARVVALRDAYPLDVYVERLDACRKGLESGAFDLVRSETVRAHIQSFAGLCLLLSLLGKCSEADVMVLLGDRREELEQVVHLALERSLARLRVAREPNEKKAPAA